MISRARGQVPSLWGKSQLAHIRVSTPTASPLWTPYASRTNPGGAGYAGLVSDLALFKLFLSGFAVAGIVYVCVGSGVFQKANENWWGSLPKRKKMILAGALAATLLQTLL